MNLYMPLFMGYLAYSFPSGLALYFITSNVVGILQYAIAGKVNWRNLLPARLQAGPGIASNSTESPKKNTAAGNKPTRAKNSTAKKRTSPKRPT
jgi:YidC/Oxa1 family membrane protein insertase